MTPQQKREMIAEAGCNPRTLARWLLGKRMRAQTKGRLDDAARVLGLYKLRGDEKRVNGKKKRR